MSSDSPPTKRRRMSDALAPDVPVNLVKRSLRFWFDDGSVVLQAEDTQFRVHQTLLSLHSEVMKGCFSCPQPNDAENLEGCPVVRLPDSALDIDNLCALLYGLYQYVLDILDVFHFTHKSFSINDRDIEFSYLTTMVRLGRKYEISYWKTSAMSFLRRLFPRDPNQWVWSHYAVKNLVAKNQSYLFDVVNLAYENHISSVVPIAFLNLLTIHNLVCPSP